MKARKNYHCNGLNAWLLELQSTLKIAQLVKKIILEFYLPDYESCGIRSIESQIKMLDKFIHSFESSINQIEEYKQNQGIDYAARSKCIEQSVNTRDK